MTMNTAELKQAAKRFGADLIGIVSAADLAYLPLRKTALHLPQATCAIVVGNAFHEERFEASSRGQVGLNSFSQYGFLTMEGQLPLEHRDIDLDGSAGIQRAPLRLRSQRKRLAAYQSHQERRP